jgi:hypothetical protein
LCPPLDPNFKGFEKILQPITRKKIVELGRQLDLEIHVADVCQLVASHAEVLSREDLTERQKSLLLLLLLLLLLVLFVLSGT